MIVRLSLQGLRCKACISAVRSVLEENDATVIGVTLKSAEFEVPDEDTEKIEKIVKEIKELGYEAKIVEIQR
ncbi:MAG: cation transporter [Archaeoglobaceae archaeon]